MTDLSRLPPEAQRKVYLEALYRDLGGFIGVRTITADNVPMRRTFAGTTAVETFLSNGGANGHNVYVEMATRISKSTAKGAGGKEHLHSARVLWVDFDGEAEELAAALKRFPHPPSMRVNSGNGEHLYWSLDEPFDLSTETNRHRFECILKGLADRLGGDRAATDSSRILRVPGTTNFPNAKKRAEGRTEVPAVLLELHS